jgi:hypothetical protein
MKRTASRSRVTVRGAAKRARIRRWNRSQGVGAKRRQRLLARSAACAGSCRRASTTFAQVGGISRALAGAHLRRAALMPLNIPNLLTWLRIFLIPLFVGIFYFERSWVSLPNQNLVATVIFTLRAITDWLDGWLARKLNQMSAFGAFLDPVAGQADGRRRADRPAAVGPHRRDRHADHHWPRDHDLALREWMAQIGASRKRRGVAARKDKDRRADDSHPDAALRRSRWASSIPTYGAPRSSTSRRASR